MAKSFGLIYGTLNLRQVGSGFERIVGPTLGSLFRRNSRRQRKNRIGDEVVGAEENAGGRSREIDHAERLAALGHGDALNAPAIRHPVGESGCVLSSRKLIHITHRQHVRAIEIRRGIGGSGIQGIVSVEKKARTQPAAFIERMRVGVGSIHHASHETFSW